MSTRGVIGTGVAIWALALSLSVRAHPGPAIAAAAPHPVAKTRPAVPPASVAPKSAERAKTEPIPPSNADCLACHGDGSAVRADGRPVVVKPEAFEHSVHGPLSCVDCHQDLAKGIEFPHPEKLAKVDCSTCHPDSVAKYKEGVHARERAKGSIEAARCVDCHGMHDIKPKSDPESRTYHLNIAATCTKCHGDADVIRKGGIPSDVTKLFADSIHGLALSKSGLVVAPTCSDCHSAHDVRRRDDPNSHVSKMHVPATCGRCHEGISNQFNAGAHGMALAKGNTGAPTCQTCHTAHGIQRAETASWQLSVIGQCGTCHLDRIATFRDTFHGQVTNLGFRTVASCADCHGAHEMLPASDPRSPISKARLVATCGKCHPNASENFVKYDPHADKHRRAGNPVLYFTARFMTILLAGVFGFFGLHTTMWFMKELHVRRARRRRAGEPVAVHGARSGEGTDGRDR